MVNCPAEVRSRKFRSLLTSKSYLLAQRFPDDNRFDHKFVLLLENYPELVSSLCGLLILSFLLYCLNDKKRIQSLMDYEQEKNLQLLHDIVDSFQIKLTGKNGGVVEFPILNMVHLYGQYLLSCYGFLGV